MSLLDDVSIVVTPNGYKAGELYAVIPVPTEGAEILSQPVDLVTDFIVNSGGVIVDADTFDTFGGTYDGIRKNFCFTVGKRYKLTIQGDTTSSGFTIGDTSGSGNQYGSGFGTFYFTALGNGSLWIRQQTSGTTNITSFSIKEYTAADMDVTRATDATKVNESGLIADVLSNVPRIDYTGGGCPHILAEPQRKNEVTYSEDFSQWTLSDITLGSDGVSPSGQTNANLIQTGTAGSDQVSKIFTLSATNTTTYSVFIKRVSGAEWVDFLIVKLGFSNSLKVWFNINTGSVGSNNQTGTTTLDNASIESFGNNWYKLNVTTTDTTNNTSFNIRVRTASADGSDTRVNNSSYYLWGMQLEESYATSYIPTSGSTVTRNQDIFTRDGIGSLINSPEGVLFVEMAALSNDSTRRTISLSDGTNTNRVVLRYDNANNRVQGFIQVGGATNGNINDNSYTITNFLKIAYKWKAGDFALWINGTEVAVSTSATSFGAGVLTQMQFNEGDGAGLEYFGKVKQLQVYTTALTDEQLTSLTS